jgi:sulfur carrier protein
VQIQLNGKPHDLPESASVKNLLDSLQLTGRRIAVEVNEDIVPRSCHDQHKLCGGDQVEVVHAIGGG